MMPSRLMATGRQLCCVMLYFIVANSWAIDQTPDAFVRQTTEAVLQRIRAEPPIADGNSRALAEIVEMLLLGHFDFAKMTQLAVGKNWRNIESTKRPELVREFQTLLVRTYSVALASYRDQEISYQLSTLSPDGLSAVVKTTITQASEKPIAMDYRMSGTAEGWKVYDIVVEGVSLVINYRSVFNSTVEASGIDGLLKLLRDKNAAAR
ncbi:MAG: phospholipid transport system substrate-binding protein [Gammaproteobacteria bacterium]|jgi:phospholipid transport system substrate-binding protein